MLNVLFVIYQDISTLTLTLYLLYPNINIDNDVTTRSLTGFSKHIKSKFLSGYSLHGDIGECYACNNS